ncbi:hypothetical protein R3P38DRAFT_3267516 [Favolaschia claudopus]|uniref:Uncharacterized protein n=1 Tax=Favolaschia claudopus TaxID=2862362 RepID=A0AAW0BNI1_9AGAR
MLRLAAGASTHPNICISGQQFLGWLPVLAPLLAQWCHGVGANGNSDDLAAVNTSPVATFLCVCRARLPGYRSVLRLLNRSEAEASLEYLYNLANAVRELSPESYDKHLFALEELVKALDEKNRSSVPPLH